MHTKYLEKQLKAPTLAEEYFQEILIDSVIAI